MIFWKKVEIDLEAERVRINTPRLYNKVQRKWLNDLVDLVERGEFVKALGMVIKKRTYREFIGCEVWSLLWNVSMGGEYRFAETVAKLARQPDADPRAWKKLSKKGGAKAVPWRD